MHCSDIMRPLCSTNKGPPVPIAVFRISNMINDIMNTLNHLGNKNIYLTTSNGRLFIINILSGKTEEILKIDRERISRPFVLNQNLFIIKNNAIIKLK